MAPYVGGVLAACDWLFTVGFTIVALGPFKLMLGVNALYLVHCICFYIPIVSTVKCFVSLSILPLNRLITSF